jgi:pSer/pThr/pTyr-binding forkhead associated (FHA) protein
MSQRYEPEPTRLESSEEIQRALQARRAQKRPQAPHVARQEEPEVQLDFPLQRPPIAMLCILDDGKQQEGEWVRLRADRTTIGRVEGDVVIPHDGQLSGRHAEIVREKAAAGWRWRLVDLQSSNGTFVRIAGTPLRHANEFLIGRGRYRFEAAAAPPAPAPAEQHAVTLARHPWSADPARPIVPSLVEITPAGPVGRSLLSLPEYWIGRDARACGIARPDDPLVNPRHARLHRDGKGQWHLDNHASVNGVWLRIDQIHLAAVCQLRLGEQRFLFRVG